MVSDLICSSHTFGDMSKCFFINIPVSIKHFQEQIFICGDTRKSSYSKKCAVEDKRRGRTFPSDKTNCMPLDPHTSVQKAVN